MPFLYALLTVFAWGIWLIPSQNVKFSGQQVRTFYVAAANLLIAALFTAAQGFGQVTADVFWLPFWGGVVWSLGGWAAFSATEKLGPVRAYGIWAPLNIVVSVALGAVLLHEFVSLSGRAWTILFGSVALIVVGVLLIIFSPAGAKGAHLPKASLPGFACAVAAGVLWAVYYIPVKLSHVSMWVAAFPLACGMLVGCVMIVLFSRQTLKLDNRKAYGRALSSGVLWASGNYGMLLMVDTLGAGKGFTFSQLALVVNALCGIYVLKDPKPNTRAAYLALLGCAIATTGAIVLGTIK
ncbi:MAG: GRP family sugar transporter [Verrucomicrobiota bacterium]